jgi:hypothetical protein
MEVDMPTTTAVTAASAVAASMNSSEVTSGKRQKNNLAAVFLRRERGIKAPNERPCLASIKEAQKTKKQ